MYLALTIFADDACTIFNRVVHLDDGQQWLADASKILGRPVKEGDSIIGVRVDRIGSELCEA